ncbi:MAG: tetratricopeptide repeat protein, partial [Nitrososphaeraceae archaeon]
LYVGAKGSFLLPNSILIKFLYAHAIQYYKIYQKAIEKNDYSPFGMDPHLISIFEKLKKPDFDATKLFLEALKADPLRIIDIQETYVIMTEDIFEKYPSASQGMCESFGKIEFPSLSIKSIPDIFISVLHTQLANYCEMAGLRDKAIEESEKALLIYKDNSYALVLQASLTVDDDSIKAESMFKKALQLADTQFVGDPRQRQLQIKINAYLGLGYVYYKRTIYDIAEKYCCNALDLQPEPYFEAVILVNRGRNRLDDGDLIGAKADFYLAKKDPFIAPIADCNLGFIYYKQGLYEKAKSEFIKAIEKMPDLPQAYYNLGVLYNEEGDKERARKLFQTALNIDRDYKEAKQAMKKLDNSDVSNIGDWYDWWFSSNASTLKKGIGIATLILIGVLIGKASYDAVLNSDIKQSMFGIIAIAIVFLVLPLISKLKVGPVELEMESKGQQPPLA